MFKQRKHKKFNYKPRFSEESKTDSNIAEAPSKKDFVSKWKRERGAKKKMGLTMSTRTLILVLVLLLICMYILDSKFR